MKLSDIKDEIDKRVPQDFFDFTNKWIDFVVNNIQIDDKDWNVFFKRTNPVAGIDRGEMLDKVTISTKNGKKEINTNERKSFIEKWGSDIRPKISEIIYAKNESDKITEAKELNKLILKIIVDGGGRNMQVAINRILATFFPDLFIPIPNNEDLKYFIDLLKKKVFNGSSLTDEGNWIDNSYQIKKFFDNELNDNTLAASAWYFYIYLKTNKNNSMDDNKVDEFIKLLKGNYNLILTGAPGTGKTYLAKKIAKEMGCDDEHIGFVQFHPSYDYTDFVEGLRPIKKGDTLGFERKDGVFKIFCKKALENFIINTKEQTVTIESAFSELWEKINKGEIKTLKLFNGGESLPMIVKEDNKQMIYFSQKNNLDVISTGNEVSLDKVKKAFENNKITTIQKLNDSGPNRDELGSGGNVSNLWAIMNYLLTSMENIKNGNFENSNNNNYVFIIDEINRGEISKIFGELFYSIDPGYRGEDGIVKTQYQNLIPKEGDPDFDKENPDVFREGFYVPKNVYIIGTMNDIDRSVESMDFAMRRRFAWKEITAKSRQSMLDENDAWGSYGKPSPNIIEEIKTRMDNLNAAIIDEYNYGTVLSNKDKIGLTKAYQIGAAYFLKYALYKDLENPFEKLWTNHLEGLLREYLRGKTNIDEKIERLHQAYKVTTTH